MNHELRPNRGVVRKHGKIGAFVSELEIDSDTHEVEQGRDLIDSDIRYWNYVTQAYGPVPSPGSVNPREYGYTAPKFRDFLQRRTAA